MSAQTKVMTASEAVSKFVMDGDCLALGGFVTNRRAYGIVYEIIRQKKRNLYLESGSAGGDADMLIGAGCIQAINISYMANSGFTQVCRRFREAVEQKRILFEDYSLDVQTAIYHGAALGLPYVAVKNMLGSDLVEKWGISEEERKKHKKLPLKKLAVIEDPFKPGEKVCAIPTPEIDVACIHVQIASSDGTFRIVGPTFQDLDIAIAAKHTIISCEQLISDDEIRRHPELNSVTGLCVDAVIHMPYGAHPSQCFGLYDYDPKFFIEYDAASKTQETFEEFMGKYVYQLEHGDYLDKIGASHLMELGVEVGMGYRPKLKRK